jgi:two-component system sensor histidine kinase TctE
MLKPLRRWSLRQTLLAVLLPGLLGVMALELYASWRTALAAANAAYDRSLLGAIKAMDANISTASGGLSVELPYRMLEFFELTANGQVFYRVASGDGLVEIGNAELPAPPRPLIDGQPQFSDAVYYGVPIRLGSYARRLTHPLSQGSDSDRVVVQVGETLESRQDFTRRLVLEAVARDLLLLLAAGALVVLGVGGALRPLQRLRQEMVSRPSDDLTAIRAEAVPAEVQPLVQAINIHMARYQEVAQARRRFVDDASHQLRTPLATLITQVAYALREPDLQRKDLALAAIKTQLDDAVRQTNQMLALARADSAELTREPTDVLALGRELTRSLWPLARQRGVDLGFEPLGDGMAATHGALMREALANLVHNALLHTPRGAQVTVQAGLEGSSTPGEQRLYAVLRVIDDGPGMPPEELQRVGERFFRGQGGRAGGSGLGLAIARAIVERHGGQLLLTASQPGPAPRGLTATLRWPASADAPTRPG